MSTIEDIACELRDDGADVQLLYAFNSVGKTRLSVAYKNATKDKDGIHAGIYYNAYSEDLFVWNNDIENREANIRLSILPSSLSRLHADLTELNIHAKLKPYRPSFDFRFVMHKDAEKGIESISFFPTGTQPGDVPPMKLSRGEERIFVWCFFLAMMEVEGWADKQTRHIFVDDPVSSLDDHNIFVTASTLYDLIETYFGERKIIIATHHIGMFSILYDWLKKGEKSSKYARGTRVRILSGKQGAVSLEAEKNAVFLYHLRILQVLEQARRDNDVRAHHFALLRQLLENVSSFLGVGRISYALERIGFDDAEDVARIVNALSHKNVYYFESDRLVPDNLELFESIYEKLNAHYAFVAHTG
ncbi:anticodon nuclease [Azospirillum sp. TSH100]|uniref:AAA family ATPase n=1 Tax=Azospirillum sp. TSH100 TaxID=652764 RepID=UPI000D605E75|nr:AAA family ATPase [Azospirillum sp. TSH100]PWC81512.1 anticodon nuclease [Azospirillum sp. TSH100]QCG91356.1 anticodon nuclease [Azospirillum sp. TSH100]